MHQHPDPENDEQQPKGYQQQAQPEFKNVKQCKHKYSFQSFVLSSSAALSIACRNEGTCSSSFSNLIPVRLSMIGGSCATICVTSPVSLLAPPPPTPLPELMITILSVFASGSLILPATSGRIRIIISTTAASLYCLNDSALTLMASAVAFPCASITAASANPR